MLGRVSPLQLDRPQIFGGYLLVEALGRGAMGDVYLARPLDADRGLPCPIVVKRLHGELTNSATFVARFRHEAAVAVCVDNPHVARAYDAGSVGDTLYIALEYVPGWPLSGVLDEIMKSGRHASVASVIDLLAGGLEGLHALHTAKDTTTGRALDVVHRDLSPKNLMVDEEGNMRLIDFGLGKSKAQDWRTRTGAVMGSVGYMAPEQARGERVDARADVYSMGVVAFEMLALRSYITKASVPEMVHQCTRPTFFPPSQFRSDVPKAIDRVIEKALRPDPSERFESAAAFLAALRAVVPPTHTQGTMVALLNEIFGSTKHLREAKLAHLMALPLPDDFETRPTQIFVMRDGIVPLEEVMVRTVQTQQMVSYSAAPASDMVMPVQPLVTPVPNHSGGIGVSTLIGAVLAAAILGGVISVLVVLSIVDNREGTTAPTQVSLQEPPPEPVRALPTVTSRPTAQVKPATAVTPAPPVRNPAPSRRPTTPRAAVSPPPPPVQSVKVETSLDAQLDALEAQAKALRQSAPSPARRSTATKILLDIAQWRRSQDLPRKAEAVRDLKDKLQALK